MNRRFYCDGSPETRHARNVASNPAVAVHLESAERVIILNGTCRAVSKPALELATQVSAAYGNKYGSLGYAPLPNQWDNGGLFEVTPTTILAWTEFTKDPTKFTF